MKASSPYYVSKCEVGSVWQRLFRLSDRATITVEVVALNPNGSVTVRFVSDPRPISLVFDYEFFLAAFRRV